MRTPLRFLAAAGLVLAGGYVTAKETRLFPLLATAVRGTPQANGVYLLPTNQLLRPWGEQAVIAGRPVELTFDAARQRLAVLNWRSVLLVDPATGATTAEVKTRSTSYTGVAFRPDGREVWASETARNGPDTLAVIPLDESGKPGELERVELQGHPVPAGIAFAADGARAFVALSRNNSLGVVSVSARHLTKQIPVGVAPFGVVLSPKHNRLFVSNRGGRRAKEGDSVAPSSGTAVVADPVTGSSTTGTVSVIDLADDSAREVSVGLAPSGMALSPDENTLAVANGHSDSVTLLDTQTLARTDVKVPSYPEGMLGAQPIAVQFSLDGSRLYVACGGTNAITILTATKGKWKAAGALPTGWFPSSLAVDRDGGLRVLNIKGVGNTKNAKGLFNSRQYEGSLVRMPAPADVQMAAGQREVKAANQPEFEARSGGISNPAALGIQHVILIVKENRTYDQVFGDLPQGNGDPKLAIFGRDVTPNHHALAEKYALLDNFYTGGAISFDGHQWLMQGFVSDYVERAFAASPRGYAWNMADSLVVPPTGFFWQGGRRPIDVQIFGEFCLEARYDPDTHQMVDMNENQLLTWQQYYALWKAGKWKGAVGSRSGVPALAKLVRPLYPAGTTAITDQIRADEFIEEVAAAEKAGHWPRLTVLTLNQDHTNGTRPGSPTPRAMVADNDLALGRMVEAVSKSRFWANTLILVVEDDAQDGLDHVDGRRTVALAIGPNVRRGVVDSNNYNHTSMIRTIQDLLGVPPRTRALQAARAMNSLFTKERDTGPYTAVPAKIAFDEINPPVQGLRGRQRWAAEQSAKMNWREIDDVPEKLLNQILWWNARGYDTPYPGR